MYTMLVPGCTNASRVQMYNNAIVPCSRSLSQLQFCRALRRASGEHEPQLMYAGVPSHRDGLYMLPRSILTIGKLNINPLRNFK